MSPLVSLSSIDVTPVNPILNIGATQQFVATGNYSNGMTYDLSNSVLWESSDETMLTVTNSGLATVVTSGHEQITATFQGLVGAADVVCISNVATLSNIEISPEGSGLFPVFDPSVLNYTMDADLLDSDLDVTASTTNIYATIRWRFNNGAWSAYAAGGDPFNIPIAIGVTVLQIQVRAENGVSSQTYRVNISKLGN